MNDKNARVWKNNLEQLIKFREINGRLPSNNTNDAKYEGEVKLNSWYKRQVKNYRLKIGQLNKQENYEEFEKFLKKYNYGNKREIEKVNIGGKIINKVSVINLDDEINNRQTLNVKMLNVESFNNFLKILNDALREDGREEINIETITYRKTKDNSKMGEIDWRNMPEFKFNEDLLNVVKIKVCLSKCPERTDRFRKILMNKINQQITYRTSSIWFPNKLESMSTMGLMYEDSEDEVIPKYPIYIISYKRHESRLTAKYLEECGIDYKIVIREEDYTNYSSVIDPKKILVLPPEYSDPNSGGIPARNFVLHHSRQQGDKRHWILDDNINGYYRVNNCKRYKIKSGAVFRIIEDYVDRYENVLMAGHNYKFFVVPTKNGPPITINTRIYSSILLSNETEFEWRGKYNEDTDLSLRILKAGFATILFNNIVCDKIATLKMKGGNQEIYSGDGVYLKAKSLEEQHPDVVKIGTRFGRIHHIVDYSKFKNNKLICLKSDIENKVNEYGLELKEDENYTGDEEEEIICC